MNIPAKKNSLFEASVSFRSRRATPYTLRLMITGIIIIGSMKHHLLLRRKQSFRNKAILWSEESSAEVIH
jgi:hypothetical protein